jgi:hypothetical protein
MNKIYFKDGINSYPFIDEHIEKDIYIKEDKNIIVYVDSLPKKNVIKKENEIWIYIQVESYYVLSHLMVNIYDFDFDLILTFTEHFYKNKKTIKFLPYNKVYWISPTLELKKNLNLPFLKPINYDIKNKKFQVSMLCGSKNWCPGHKFRRQVWLYQEKFKFKKKFMYSKNHDGLKIFDNKEINHRKDKTELFIDSMFHIAIENNQAIDYFTEKLIDCFVSKTIPIYYGCPNIGDYFELKGMIIINDINDIDNLNNILSEEYYNDRLHWIEDNYYRVVNNLSFKDQFIKIIENRLNLTII